MSFNKAYQLKTKSKLLSILDYHYHSPLIQNLHACHVHLLFELDEDLELQMFGQDVGDLITRFAVVSSISFLLT